MKNSLHVDSHSAGQRELATVVIQSRLELCKLEVACTWRKPMNNENHEITRRQMMKFAGAVAGLGGLALAGKSSGQSAPAQPTRSRAIRIAHLTDIHVQPELKADQGLIACLHHVQNLKDRPELILTGGDCVYDSFEAENTRTQLQWDLWQSAFKNECSIRV